MIILITSLWNLISFLTLISYFSILPHYYCRKGGFSETVVSAPVSQLGYGLLTLKANVQSSPLLLQMIVMSDNHHSNMMPS